MKLKGFEEVILALAEDERMWSMVFSHVGYKFSDYSAFICKESLVHIKRK